MYVCMYVCMYVYAYIHIVYIITAVFAACRRLEQRHKAPTEREAPEVILRGIDVQCNKRSPLVPIKNLFSTQEQEKYMRNIKSFLEMANRRALVFKDS